MTIQQDYQLRPHVEREFTATGIVGPDNGIPLNMTGNVRVAVENAGATNAIEVQGRLVGQSSWVTLITILSTTAGVMVDMTGYDEIRFNCSVYSASGGTPKLLASGFFNRSSGGGYNTKLFDGADYFSATYPTAIQDVWTFKSGGSSGVTVATITLNYSDAARTDPSDGTIG